jgi:uncharacterized membrane protein
MVYKYRCKPNFPSELALSLESVLILWSVGVASWLDSASAFLCLSALAPPLVAAVRRLVGAVHRLVGAFLLAVLWDQDRYRHHQNQVFL